MKISDFFRKLKTTPEEVSFEDTMNTIEESYDFAATAFENGTLSNEEGQNSGSCKLFYFAKLNDLTEEETLFCFGNYYRIDVLEHPEGEDHQNIRNFMKTGWTGVSFKKQALFEKQI
ncbi:HopJ type III effector protein [Aquimarina sediminis]|uniref:HopJ type III effector protein n=1 Tax=Aquimarina sediminis TaxID=2070536 RepID=UPI000C9FFCCA|nr:HopJ type III effector protein [Aquimarina sediminis]